MLLEDLQDDPKGEIIEKPMVFQYFYSKVSVSLETSSEKYSPTAGGVHSPREFSLPRFKRPRLGSARHAWFTRPCRYQWEPSCFAPRFKRPRRVTRQTVTTCGKAPFKRLRFGSKRDSRAQTVTPLPFQQSCPAPQFKRSRRVATPRSNGHASVLSATSSSSSHGLSAANAHAPHPGSNRHCPQQVEFTPRASSAFPD